MGERGAEKGAGMNRGRTEAETVALNGWSVGTLVRGHEQWADGVGVWTTWRITAIGEESVLVRGVYREYTGTGADRPDDDREGMEHTATFKCREWTRVVPSDVPTPSDREERNGDTAD